MSESLSVFSGEHSLPTLPARLTLLLMIGWALHAGFRRCHPQWRVWLWRSVTVGVPVLVLGSAVLPQWTWELAVLDPAVESTPPDSAPAGLLLANAANGTGASVPANATFVPPATDGVRQPQASPPVPSPAGDAGATRHRISWADVPGIGWLLIALCLLSRVVIEGVYAGRLARRSRHAPEDLTAAGLAAARELSVRTQVEFRVCDRFASPFVTGIRRSVVVIPHSLLRNLDAAQLRLVLLHELAHVRGRDVAWSMAVRAIQSLLWFHPLAWGIHRAHRQGCEAACDALAAAADRGSYRQFLAQVALWARQAGSATPSGALPATADITWRLRQLDGERERRPPSLRRRAAATIVVAGATVFLCAANVALTEASADSVETDESPERATGSAADPETTDDEAAEAANTPDAPRLTAADVAELARLQGVWQAISGDDDGDPSHFSIHIDGTTLWSSIPPPPGGPRDFVLETDPEPKRLVFGEGNEQQFQVYRFVGDRLQLCFNPDGGDQPTDFTKGVILTFRRLISGEQLTAVRNGLAFLGRSQAADGSFAFGSGELKSRVGITALCGMALANGGALAPGDAGERIDRAVDYILSHQDERGFFKGPVGMLYDHGFAMWFLAWLHRMDQNRGRVNLPLQRAVELTINSQQANGGWGYQPVRNSDTHTDVSITSLQLRSLVEARRRGFDVSDDCLSAGVRFLKEHQSASGQFRYMHGAGAPSFSCTAEALSALKHLGIDDEPVMVSARRALAEYTAESSTRRGGDNWFLYGTLFAVDAMEADADVHTHDWYVEVCKNLVECQGRDGSWTTEREPAGKDYSTALACLILLPRSVLEP